MATPSSTQKTYETIGRREDLTNIIYNVDPTDTPFLTAIARNNGTNTLHI